MKKITSIALLLLPAAVFAQTGAFTIKGSVSNMNAPAKAFLLYSTDGQNVTDSTSVVNGAFEFKGTVPSAVSGSIILAHAGENFGTIRRSRKIDRLSFYVDPGTVVIKGADSLYKSTVTGSLVNNENQQLQGELKPYNDKMTALYAEESAAGSKATAEMSEAFDKRENAIDAEKKVVIGKFIKAHPNSFVSLNNVQGYIGYYAEAVDLEYIYNILSPELKATKQGKAYAEMIPKLRLVALGAQAPLFTQNDKDGNPISLASFKGKYVLIDFWASWCGPCRHENPNVVKAYNQFKDKNFTILGVSLDQPTGKEKWLKAIADDGLTWTQVSDLKFWKNEVSTMYGVQAIPQNFLIDPNGKIIGKNLFGQALVSKLTQVTAGGTKSSTGVTTGSMNE